MADTPPYIRWVPPELKNKFPSVKFQLVSSSQIAQEDETTLDQVVTIFLHRITTDENSRAATRVHAGRRDERDVRSPGYTIERALQLR